MGIDLPLIWAIIIAFGLMMYVIMDGFDLGIGILFPFVHDRHDRDTMVDTIAPVWDGNETWLVFGGAALLAILNATGVIPELKFLAVHSSDRVIIGQHFQDSDLVISGMKMVFGSALGMKIGPVPIGVLLLWYVIVLGARETILRLAPKSSQIWLALGGGVLVGLTGLNLENTAARFRGYWFWVAKDPRLPPVFQPPAGEYLAWFLFGIGIIFFLREQRIAANAGARSWKPVIIFALLNTVFFLANCGRAIRG